MGINAADPEFCRLVERLNSGDGSALDECLQAVNSRLGKLARQMLRNFPTVRRWADTDDVLQNTLIRLQRVLQQWKPSTSEDFFQMAAAQMRRALLDLARFFSKREQAGLRAAGDTPFDVEDIGDSSSELERWCTFHEAVERLPDDQRAVVTLRFYHGWPVGQIAESLKISERTVIRRWQAALWKLGEHCTLAE